MICPSAQLNGIHFLAPQRPGQIRADLFYCNCRGRLRSAVRSTGNHSKQLNNYFCAYRVVYGSGIQLANQLCTGGPKTFIAQSFFNKDSPSSGNSWWLLQTATKVGSGKNLFLELKDIESRSLLRLVLGLRWTC